MDNEPGIPPPGPCYLLPEPAYHHLQDIRDHLLLLARLTAVADRIADEEGLPNLRRALLAQCFQHLADRLDQTLVDTFWPLP
jgi:hypothetical protein